MPAQSINDLLAAAVKIPGTVNDKLAAYFGVNFVGNGTPEAVVAAGPGSRYQDVQNGATYQKVAGVGAAGWEAVGLGPTTSKRDIVFLGTSVTYAGGNSAFATAGANILSTCYAMWVQSLIHWRLNPVKNAGVGGSDSADMLARFAADVLAFKPGVVVIEPGPNDSKNVAYTAAATQANITAMLDAAQAANIHVAILTGTPSNLIDTTAKKQHQSTVNRWIRTLSNQRRGVTVVDVYRHVADPAAMLWASGYSTDLTHPNPVGAYAMAVPVVAALNDLFPKQTPLSFGADPYEMLPNPRMNGNTAGVATSTTITGGTGAASKVARTDGVPGEWQQWAATSGNNFVIQEITTGFTVGDSIYAMMEMEADAAGWASTGNVMNLECRDGANAVLASVSVGGNATITEPQPSSVVWVSNPVVIPAGTTKIRVLNLFKGAGTLRIGTMSMRKVGT